MTKKNIFLVVFIFMYAQFLVAQKNFAAGEIAKKYADSLRKSTNYPQAIKVYKQCLNGVEKPQVNLFWVAVCFGELNKADSAMLYIKLAAKKGMKYKLLETVDKDENLSKIRAYKGWNKVRDKIICNTKKYIKQLEKVKYPSIKKELERRVVSDQKYRKPSRDTLPNRVHDSL